MHTIRALLLAGVAVAVVTLAGCTGAGAPGSSQKLGGTVCPAIGVSDPGLTIYPPNGSTGIPDGNFALVVNAQTAPIYLYAPGSTTPAVRNPPTTAVPSPVPTPNSGATPGPNTVAYAIPVLSPHTTYAIEAGTTTDGCTSTLSLGSFTTQ